MSLVLDPEQVAMVAVHRIVKGHPPLAVCKECPQPMTNLLLEIADAAVHAVVEGVEPEQAACAARKSFSHIENPDDILWLTCNHLPGHGGPHRDPERDVEWFA